MSSAALQEILVRLAGRMEPWSRSEARIAEVLPGHRPYLGGDGLRPYVTWVDDGRVQLLGVQPNDLPLPPLVADILGGAHGVPVVLRDARDPRVYHATLPGTVALLRLLEHPSVLLVGLGDADRYRGARLPLGVARLSQWLRYTHAAHVEVIDYNVTAAPVDAVVTSLERESFDIVGISVNFGQWQMLEELAAVVNKHHVPLVVLGNILAAFSPTRAAGLFDTVPKGATLVATGLGERPMELLCREHRNPSAWDDIVGLVRPSVMVTAPPPPRRVVPPEIVFPDDSLVLTVAARGGQISFETSFGCQYGACTFCPRDHRGDGWNRGHRTAIVAALERASSTGAVVSIVDEEFFGSEGLIDPPVNDLPAADILAACRRLGTTYEIYTRLEQIFDRRRSREWNIARARLVATESTQMKRLFVGVESGCPEQLRRYGKGQTVAQTVDSLRIGSSLGVPMEFGFITFDPLLSADELAENVAFLGRQDVIAARTPGDVEERVAAVVDYLDGRDLQPSGVPLYRYVAYMATELEVLAHSRYADHLRRRHPDLLDGTYDVSFARYGIRYRDERIGEIAGWCRVWTEGMFTAVYEARMKARASGDATAAAQAAGLVGRYRDATFALLSRLTTMMLPELADRLEHLPATPVIASGDDPWTWLVELARTTLPEGPVAAFDTRVRHLRRDR